MIFNAYSSCSFPTCFTSWKLSHPSFFLFNCTLFAEKNWMCGCSWRLQVEEKNMWKNTYYFRICDFQVSLITSSSLQMTPQWTNQSLYCHSCVLYKFHDSPKSLWQKNAQKHKTRQTNEMASASSSGLGYFGVEINTGQLQCRQQSDLHRRAFSSSLLPGPEAKCSTPRIWFIIGKLSSRTLLLHVKPAHTWKDMAHCRLLAVGCQEILLE